MHDSTLGTSQLGARGACNQSVLFSLLTTDNLFSFPRFVHRPVTTVPPKPCEPQDLVKEHGVKEQ